MRLPRPGPKISGACHMRDCIAANASSAALSSMPLCSIPIIAPLRMRPGRWLILRIDDAEPANAADRGHTLRETDEPAIHPAHAGAALCAPRIILFAPGRRVSSWQ